MWGRSEGANCRSIFCKRANHSSKEANPRSEVANSIFIIFFLKKKTLRSTLGLRELTLSLRELTLGSILCDS